MEDTEKGKINQEGFKVIDAVERLVLPYRALHESDFSPAFAVSVAQDTEGGIGESNDILLGLDSIDLEALPTSIASIMDLLNLKLHNDLDLKIKLYRKLLTFNLEISPQKVTEDQPGVSIDVMRGVGLIIPSKRYPNSTTIITSPKSLTGQNQRTLSILQNSLGSNPKSYSLAQVNLYTEGAAWTQTLIQRRLKPTVRLNIEASELWQDLNQS